MELKKTISIQELKNSQILVVDDEAGNLEIARELLEEEGYIQVTTELSSIKAIELYKNKRFDLLLLDLNMPEMNGFEVMSALADIPRDSPAPILILTALNDQMTCNQALSSGATDFLSKPFNLQEALNRIQNILLSHHYQKKLFNINELLEQQVKVRTQELLDSKLKVIQHLGFAAEYRDTETAAHTIRVGEYSRVLGEKLGLDEQFIKLLNHAAPLHDIGKIGIPDAVLLKPGGFDAGEWSIMKGHAAIGGKILENDDDPLIKMARTIALTHHEKWNGSGYPNGLKGLNIPIEGRIVMLADVFDALMMERPYKKEWTIEETVCLIKKESGVSFEPKLVDLFLTVVDEFIEIRQGYKD